MNAKVFVLDDYRQTSAVLLTDAQEARLRVCNDIIESLHDNARMERLIQEHLLKVHHSLGDISA